MYRWVGGKILSLRVWGVLLQCYEMGGVCYRGAVTMGFIGSILRINNLAVKYSIGGGINLSLLRRNSPFGVHRSKKKSF